MDSQTIIITSGLGITTLILAAATAHCFTQSLEEARHGSFRRALLWVSTSAPLAYFAMFAGILALVKGAALG